LAGVAQPHCWRVVAITWRPALTMMPARIGITILRHHEMKE
jgi:hypothetical protein